MNAVNFSKAAVIAAAMVWAAGCSTTGTNGANGTGAGADGAGLGANAYGSGNGSVNGTDLNDVNSLQTVFYFDFDQSVVRQDGFADLEAHAHYLSSHPSASVRLEGHADERGTREYNMALGERRAQAVERLLIVNGASAGQIETVSYGEEKPAVLGHDDSSLAQNRRVELKYVSK